MLHQTVLVRWRLNADSHYQSTWNAMYTVNHKKCDISYIFLTISSAFGYNFLQFLYHFNREEILHATIIKFITSPDICGHLTWKNPNLHFCRGSWFIQSWFLLNRFWQIEAHARQLFKMGPCQITDMWLWPAADYEPYHGRVSIDKVRWRTTTTSRSWRQRSQVAGVYNDYSISEMKWLNYQHIARNSQSAMAGQSNLQSSRPVPAQLATSSRVGSVLPSADPCWPAAPQAPPAFQCPPSECRSGLHWCCTLSSCTCPRGNSSPSIQAAPCTSATSDHRRSTVEPAQVNANYDSRLTEIRKLHSKQKKADCINIST